jgi:SAM-dependent methyltransferase
VHDLVRRYLPSALTLRARRAYFATLAALHPGAEPEGDPLLPPRHLLDFVGGGDFLAQGRLHRELFIRHGGLRPEDDVLDVGCGIGRMAVPLTGFLAADARYEGFDIVPEAIAWCQAHISAQHPNFHFQLADIHNRTYNPRGRLAATAYRFPYPDASFDFQLSTSVFTHLRRPALAHYLAEIARVLRPGGRCLNTFFLLADPATDAGPAGRPSQDFRYAMPDGGRSVSPVDPEKAIAFDAADVLALMAQVGLRIEAPVLWGSWRDGSEAPAYQDMVVARRTVAA